MPMNEKIREPKIARLELEVEEIEKRDRGRPSCTSSTTHDLCTCRCSL